MHRKVLALGRSTYAITLPVSWLKLNNIIKGDIVDLEIHDKNIFLKTDIKKEEELNYNKDTFFEITNFYDLCGVKKIKILNLNKKIGIRKDYSLKKENNELYLIKKEQKLINNFNIVSLLKMCSLIIFLKRNPKNNINKLYLRIKSKIKQVEYNISNNIKQEKINTDFEKIFTTRVLFFLKYFIKDFYNIIDKSLESYCFNRLFIDNFNIMISFYNNEKTIDELILGIKENIIYGKKYLKNIKLTLEDNVSQFLENNINSLSLLIN